MTITVTGQILFLCGLTIVGLLVNRILKLELTLSCALGGAIAIALVLSLPTSLPYWWIIQSAVFGVVVFSMVVQGTANKALIKKFECS